MRKAICIIGILGMVALALGMSLPAAHAQSEDTGGFVFHVLPNGTGYISQNLSVIPSDAQDKIIIAGSSTTTRTRAALQNLCGNALIPTGTPTAVPSPTPTGTVTPSAPCAAVDLYYQLVWTLNWNSGLRDDCSTWGVCDRNVAPVISIEYGGSHSPINETWGNCGQAAHATGSCTNSISGKINAADIENENIGEGFILNEYFDVSYSEYWGGTTFETSYDIILSTSPILEDCAGQFNIGGTRGTITIPADANSGIDLRPALGGSYPAPGEWYAVHVSGYWQNDGTGPELHSLAHKTGNAGAWLPLIGSADVACSDTDNNTYYLQMLSNADVFLRVYDTDGYFGDNTGSLTVTISSITAYDPYPSGCELQFKVGNLLEQRTVMANNYIGQPLESDLPPSPGGTSYTRQSDRYYMLETIGGPAIIAGVLGSETYSWDADLGQRENSTSTTAPNWHEATAAPFVVCSRQIDAVGHVRVFFPAERQAEILGAISRYFYSFRVRDTGASWDGNSGSLGYRLYLATEMQVTTPGDTPGPDGCAKYSHGDTAVGSVTIQAVAANGSVLPDLTSEQLYALEVTGGPWQEAGSTDSYSVELSSDNGETWTDLQDYPNLLCAASADGDHVIIYVYGAAGAHWKARVNDTDSNFGTNTGTINLDVYEGTTTINEYPECASSYSLTKVPLSDEQRKIPGNIEAGVAIPANSMLGASMTYSIEITDEGKWYEAGAGDGSYLVDISQDGGATWTALEDYTVLCKETLGDTGDRFQIYFNSYGNNYKLRVRDGDGNFLNNTGLVMYNLYKAQQNNYTPGPGGTVPAPAEWVVACDESYSRPGGFISWNSIGVISGVSINIPVPLVGEWIDYLRNAIIYYFAWCPQDMAALQSLSEDLKTKEPMASINSMVAFVTSIQTLIQNSQALGSADPSVNQSMEPQLFSDQGNINNPGGGAGTDPTQPTSHGTQAWDLFTVWNIDPAYNVWFGGKIDLTSGYTLADLSSMNSYTTFCTDKFYTLFGIVSGSYCSLIALLRYSKTMTMILLVMDLLISAWFLLKYFPGYLKKFINLGKGIA